MDTKRDLLLDAAIDDSRWDSNFTNYTQTFPKKYSLLLLTFQQFKILIAGRPRRLFAGCRLLVEHRLRQWYG